MINKNFQTFLSKFYLTSKGKALLDEERELLNHSLSHVFGYYLLQIGQTSNIDLLTTSRVSFKVLVDINLLDKNDNEFVQAHIDYLPFKKDSIDAVLLPHSLETVEDPYHLLRQVDKMILPEGHLIISGFNTIGKKIIPIKFGEFKQQFKQAHLIKESRLIDWLNLLGYDIECIHYKHSNKKIIKWSLDFYIEMFFAGLRKVGLEFGNVYVILAKKRIESSTPIGLNWQLSNWLPKKRAAIINASSNNNQEKKCKQ